MSIRTDLAVEAHELSKSEGKKIDGIKVETSEHGDIVKTVVELQKEVLHEWFSIAQTQIIAPVCRRSGRIAFTVIPGTAGCCLIVFHSVYRIILALTVTI